MSKYECMLMFLELDFFLFLTGRTQRVLCGGCISEPSNVLSGVPLGSVLDPLFFALHERYFATCKLYLSFICRWLHIIQKIESRKMLFFAKRSLFT